MKTITQAQKILTTIIMVMLMSLTTNAQQFEANYDESKVPEYELPALLETADGHEVDSAEEWENTRRPEILAMFEEHVYGTTPDKTFNMDYEVVEEDDNAVNGNAIRKQVKIYPFGKDKDFSAIMLIYIPKNSDKPVPAFVGYNFRGNHTIYSEPEIIATDQTISILKEVSNRDDYDLESQRGDRISRWQVEMIIDRGYALATMYYGDIDPDYDDGFQNGIHPYFYEEGQDKPTDNEWGSIGAWAWALSRMLDYFENDEHINAEQVAVFGHSRLGKTSLWAGATDERFGMVISNDSGCGGAALSRRAFGETVGRINRSFPHWFNENFNQYNENESALPVDQHMLIALAAPRPIYVASAEDDRWADPKGEFLSAKHAGPAYKLYNKEGVGVTEMPPVNEPVGEFVRYHIRTGGHDVTAYDWEQYLNFADKHFE